MLLIDINKLSNDLKESTVTDISDAAFDHLIGDGKSSKKEREKIVKLSKVDQDKLEKNILSKDSKIKKSIYNTLKSYADNFKKNENFDELKNINLTDDELIEFMDLVYNVMISINEKLITEVLKLKSNKLTKEWVKRGSKTDKVNLVSLMRFFKLTDIQIFKIFEKIKKPFTSLELVKFDIDVRQFSNKITTPDLEKLSNTLGPSGLDQFLIKLKNNIQ